MHGYARPRLPTLVFRDDEGQVIPYGSRWADNDGDGPQDTYSVTADPERFVPYVDVARAILEHLTATYDVRREEASGDTSRVRLVPADPDAAPITFTFDASPMVYVTAGARASLGWFCTCDHCDEDVEVAIDNLEQQVAAVLEGGLREWLNDPERPDDPFGDLFLACSLTTSDGELIQGGSSSVESESARDELRTAFRDVPPRWAPWPLRPGAALSP